MATVSTAEPARQFRYGADGTHDPAVFQTLLDAAAAARTTAARGEDPGAMTMFPQTAEPVGALGGEHGVEGFEYYCTVRGEHERSAKVLAWESIDRMASSDAFHAVPLIGDRPVLQIIGETRRHRLDGPRGAPADHRPHFRRTETASNRAPGRGTSGPLVVRPAAEPNEVLLACLDGALETGQRRAHDISGGLEEGFAPVDLNIVDGHRQSAADAYLTPVLHRPNLTVVTSATAHRLLLDGDRCTGVEYGVHGRVHTARAAREVVLTAGTIGSAHLLLRSGIGPAPELRRAGVDVRHALPGVGRNLHDHPRVNLVHRTRRTVPPARANHGEVIGLLRSTPELAGPDLQIIFIDIPVPNPVAPVDNGFTIGVSPMRPFSRGSLRITSADPYAAPLLDPAYFTDERDVRAVLSGVEAARAIARSSALAAWGAEEVAPGPDVTGDALSAFVRTAFTSYCHPVGTCALGEDEDSVVDSGLRVRGLTGLRVADGSVIPAIPSNNINATVYAIAERAAEFLRASV